MRCAAVVDIGGTSIKYGLVNETGAIVYKSACDSEAGLGADHLLTKVKQVIRELLSYKPDFSISGIGIASAGQIDHNTGKVLFATPIIPGYTGTDIKGAIQLEFHLPTFVENDVNAAAIGEVWLGAGTGARQIVCITVGTGIGGCIMIDGRVMHGNSGSAGEVGHLVFKYDGLPCNCGNRGCWEQYASATALARNFHERLQAGEASKIKTDQTINARIVLNAAQNGDQLAIAVVKEFVVCLGIGLVSLIHTLNPELIIIGGGVSAVGTWLTDQVYDYVKQHVMPSFLKPLKIVPAQLGNDAGIIGAARLVFEGIGVIK